MLTPKDPRIAILRKALKASTREPSLAASSKLPQWAGMGWRAIVKDQPPVVFVAACDMGFAEECFALWGFEDQTYLVGRGESLRPFITYYCGRSEKSAWRAFELHVMDAAFPETRGPEEVVRKRKVRR